MTAKRFEWTAGVGHRIKLSPMAVGRRFEMIRERDGIVTDHAVVEDSLDPKSPLSKHNDFCWGNDTKAAERWRLVVAQHVMRNLVTIELDDQGEEHHIRAFILTRQRDEAEYTAVGEVLSDEEMSRRYVARFVAEIKGVIVRFRHIKALAPVFPALKSALVEIERQHRQQKRKRRKAG